MVDKRADVWAFGAVVYEMLTGERAFVGDDVSDTLAAVLRAEGNLDRLADETPARFRQVLRACLQRDPKQRVQAIGDVRLAMEGAFETTVTVPSDAAAAPQLQVWHRPMFAAVAAVGLVVVTGLAVWSAPRGSEPVVRPLRRFAIDLGPALPIAVSNVRAMPTVSPDGTQLVYAANIIGTQKLYLRTFGQLDAQPITGIENAYEPFFSPDGEWVGFLDPIFRVLKRVSVRGGPALTLSDCYPLAGATWFPDGTIVFAHDEGGAGTTLFRIPEAGATLEPLMKVDAENGEVAHYWPRMLSGGTALLFTIASDRARADASRVAVLSLDSGEYHTVVNGGYNARYVPIGYLVFGRQGALWGVPFDVDRLVATGQEEVVLQEVELNEQYGSMALSVSADGSLVYMGGAAMSFGAAGDAFVWVDRDGGEELVPLLLRQYQDPSVSPDGSRLVVSAVDIETGVADIWVYDLTTGAGFRLTREGDNTLPRWTPDAEHVMFSRAVSGVRNLYRVRADGSSAAEGIVTSEEDQGLVSVSPDGQMAVYTRVIDATT